jgi:hypothetical protein
MGNIQDPKIRKEYFRQGNPSESEANNGFYICGFVHHQSILLNNQRDAALSSCIYSSLQGYSTCFGCFLHPSSGVQLKLQM